MTQKKIYIQSISELASLLCVSINKLYSIANSSQKYYGEKLEPKSSGGFRVINPSREPLKGIQKKLNNIISSRADLYQSSHFGIKKRSNLTNAKCHLGSREGFTCDLKSFFPSVRTERVHRALIDEQKCDPEVARIITKLVTYKYKLPQGAPTSPAIANLVTMKLQRRLTGLAKKYGLKFTIYADDITFSGNSIHKDVCKKIVDIIKDEGFKVHPKKGGIFNKTDCRPITGINIAHGASVGKQKKYWRAELHHAKVALERNEISQEDYLAAKRKYDSRMIYSKSVKKIQQKNPPYPVRREAVALVAVINGLKSHCTLC